MCERWWPRGVGRERKVCTGWFPTVESTEHGHLLDVSMEENEMLSMTWETGGMILLLAEVKNTEGRVV